MAKVTFTYTAIINAHACDDGIELLLQVCPWAKDFPEWEIPAEYIIPRLQYMRLLGYITWTMRTVADTQALHQLAVDLLLKQYGHCTVPEYNFAGTALHSLHRHTQYVNIERLVVPALLDFIFSGEHK